MKDVKKSVSKKCTSIKQLVSQDMRLFQSKYGGVFIGLVEDVHKGKRKISEKIPFESKPIKIDTSPSGLWLSIFKSFLVEERHNLPVIIDNYLFHKLKERINDVNYISLVKNKPFLSCLGKFIKYSKRILSKANIQVVQITNDKDNHLTSSVKNTRTTTLKLSQSLRRTDENKVQSPSHERWDSPVKPAAVKIDFPINLFLLSSKLLQDRPSEKYEVFSGKYVRSFLIRDIKDPNNKCLPMSRNDSRISGEIHNIIVNKEHIKTINALSRNISHIKSDAKNCLSINNTKLPNLLSKSRQGSVSDLLASKTKLSESISKVATSCSPVKIVSKKNILSFKSTFSKRNKSPVETFFKKQDFYYS